MQRLALGVPSIHKGSTTEATPKGQQAHWHADGAPGLPLGRQPTGPPACASTTRVPTTR